MSNDTSAPEFISEEWATRALDVLHANIERGLAAGVPSVASDDGPVSASRIVIPVSDTWLMDMGLIPSPPLPPEPRLVRWRRAVLRRYRGLRWKLAELIAGEPIYDRYGDGDEW